MWNEVRSIALPPSPKFGSSPDPVTQIVISALLLWGVLWALLTGRPLYTACLCWWELCGGALCIVSEMVWTKWIMAVNAFLLVDVRPGAGLCFS